MSTASLSTGQISADALNKSSRVPRQWSAQQYRVVIGSVAVLTVGILLHFYAPAALHLPGCPIHEWTGFYCPGCGTTRAIHHLLNLEFTTAFRCNPMFVVFVPFLIGWFGTRALKTLHLWRWPVFNVSIRAGYVLAALMSVWGIVRNLPYPWFVIPLQ
jgi:hypothetical protein